MRRQGLGPWRTPLVVVVVGAASSAVYDQGLVPWVEGWPLWVEGWVLGELGLLLPERR